MGTAGEAPPTNSSGLQALDTVPITEHALLSMTLTPGYVGVSGSDVLHATVYAVASVWTTPEMLSS